MTRTVPDLGTPENVVSVVFGCRPEDVAEDVVLTPFVPLASFRRHLHGPTTELAPPFFYKGITGRFAGRPVTVVLTGVGPSQVGDCMGFLSLTPATRVLFAGAVGGLDAELAIGDFFLPTEVADGEGYTRYVHREFEELAKSAPRIPCVTELSVGVEAFLRDKGLPIRTGKAFTVGSITFESRENLRTLLRCGFQALEMELSAFYSAAKHHRLRAAALTYVSDLPLLSSLWQEKTPEEAEALRQAYRALPRLALEYLCQS